jgi:hypothetical protein
VIRKPSQLILILHLHSVHTQWQSNEHRRAYDEHTRRHDVYQYQFRHRAATECVCETDTAETSLKTSLDEVFDAVRSVMRKFEKNNHFTSFRFTSSHLTSLHSALLHLTRLLTTLLSLPIPTLSWNHTLQTQGSICRDPPCRPPTYQCRPSCIPSEIRMTYDHCACAASTSKTTHSGGGVMFLLLKVW